MVSSTPQSAGKVFLQATIDEEAVNITALQKDKIESNSFDLYFRVNQGVTFSVQGSSEIHLCGYWEPTEDLLGEDGFGPFGGEDDDDDDEDELDEEHIEALKKAKQNTIKNTTVAHDVVDSDSEDEFDEDLEESSDEELKQQAKKISKRSAKQAPPAKDSDDDDDFESDDEEFSPDDLRKLLAEKRKQQAAATKPVEAKK